MYVDEDQQAEGRSYGVWRCRSDTREGADQVGAVNNCCEQHKAAVENAGEPSRDLRILNFFKTA